MATMLNPNAIPDGSITQEKIESSVLAGKQDKLTAGNGISIKDNKIGVTAITESESQPSTHLWVNPSEDAETGLTYNRSQIDALVGAKQDALTLTVKDNGNIVLANIQGQSKEFMPATPSGDPMHWAYVAAGAEYNDTGVDIVKTTPWADLADDDADKTVIHKAGYWYLNGLGDLTNEDFRLIYNDGRKKLEADIYGRANIRTNIYAEPETEWWTSVPKKLGSIFRQSKLEIVHTQNSMINYPYAISEFSYAFQMAENFVGFTNVINVKNTKDFTHTFYMCKKLKFLKLKNITANIILDNSALVTSKSILYMIANSDATSAITITLHPDVYARAMANADIVAALEAHPNVSLASA